MGKPLIIIGSITQAMKARDILSRRGIRVEIIRTPRRDAVGSCNYSVYVKNNPDAAEKILIENGMKILGRIDREVILWYI